MQRLNAVRKRPNKNKPKNTHKMEPLKPQMRPTSRSAGLFSRSPKNQKSKLSTLLVFLLLLVVFFAVAVALTFCYRKMSVVKYKIVIDGGSTGSRMHVFKYRVDNGKISFDFGGNGLWSMRVNPGLSEDPDRAGELLRELVEFGRLKVPRKYWGETEIRLMATAGLRMLDEDLRERVLESSRLVLRESGFKFQEDWATVITGSDEGLYAWVVANYALGALGGNPSETTGIIELGGASAQVTFVSNELIPSEFSRAVKFGNFTYNLYSHSFLHLGQNVAYDSLRESLALRELSTEASLNEMLIDPCTPKGYSHNTVPGSLAEKNNYAPILQSRGNFSECRSAALMFLQKGKEKCSHQHCSLGSTFTPKLSGRFLATENFFHTSKFFGLRSRAFLSELMVAGEQFCGEEWFMLRKKHQSLEDEALLQYCFSSAYIVALLHDSFGIALDDERIGFANQVGGIQLDWALGAFILQSTADQNEIAAISIEDSPTLLTLVAVPVILVLLAWSVSKCRKPQLKTIYDLEKGRYIVTRIAK